MRDMFNTVAVRTNVVTVSRTASFFGTSVGMRGMVRAVLAINVASIAVGAEWGVRLQESADNVTFTDVPAAKVQTDAPAVLVANWSYKLGYLGNAAYVRPAFTVGAAGASQIGVITILAPELLPAT
jgi:hypothetical protein